MLEEVKAIIIVFCEINVGEPKSSESMAQREMLLNKSREGKVLK